MSPLAASIAARIEAAGPISLAEFMAEALGHPEHGYYTTRDPLGAAGDFTTAPEISQMFGELLGLCLAQCWLAQGRPAPFVLAELGPGRGTLMADALRATRTVPGFAEAARVVFVETSPALRAAQALRVPAAQRVSRVEEIPAGPLFLLANEFFDALPIRQFQRSGAGWRERRVITDGRGGFALALAGETAESALAARLGGTAEGEVVEICPAGLAIAGEIGGRIAGGGGAALVIDYGGWRSLGDTLQAVRGHAPVPPLEAPGTADMTAHVDFEALAHAARPARASPLVTQGIFLERLGITARARALAERLEGEALESHVAAHRRLTHPEEMGDLFKVLGLVPPGAALPPGFET